MIKEGCVIAARALGCKTSDANCLLHFQLRHLKERVGVRDEIESVTPFIQIARYVIGVEGSAGVQAIPSLEVLGAAVYSIQDRQQQPMERHGDQRRVVADLTQLVRLQERVADAVLDTLTLRGDARNPRFVDEVEF